MQQKKILIADDDPVTLKLLESILKDEGYAVAKASNGETAIDIVQNSYVNLIILDIDMPGMSGQEVQAKLKEDPDTRNIPVIFLTGILLKEEQENLGYQVGKAFLVAKPVDRGILLEQIKKRI